MSVRNSKKKNSRNTNNRSRRPRRRVPRSLGFTGLTYAKAENWDKQYFPLNDPAFSMTFRVDLISNVARLNAQAVRFKKGVLILQTYQPNDTLFSYRVDVIRHTTPVSLAGASTATDPILYYTSQPTTANFIDSVFRVPRDQVRPSVLVSSKVFTQSTRYEHDPEVMITRINIPAHTVYFDPDSTTDNIGTGLYFVVLMTDATADSATHGVLGFRQQRFQIHF